MTISVIKNTLGVTMLHGVVFQYDKLLHTNIHILFDMVDLN